MQYDRQIPRWAKSATDGPRPVNAKAETVRTSPPFRDSFKDRRCLLPASGFFEWETVGKAKVPYLFRPMAGGLLAFAGVWDRRQPADGGEPLFTCAILTVPANATVRPLHDRMPAVLQWEHFAEWLSRSTPPVAAHALLRPAADDLLERVRVNPVVNNARTDTADCIQPVAA